MKEIFVPRYSALVGPHLEYAIEENCPYLKPELCHCGNCSNNRIGDLDTSKTKLRGAKYQREREDKAVLLTVLPRCKVLIIRNVHGLYITREREQHDNR